MTATKLVIAAFVALALPVLHAQEEKPSVNTTSVTKEVADIKLRIQQSSDNQSKDKQRLKELEAELQSSLAEVRRETGLPSWEFGYQLMKPSGRVYFDVGTDDPGEIDLFKDGSLGVSVEFGSLYLDRQWRGLTFGPYISAGVASASDATAKSVVFMWSVGLALEFRDMPFALEFGFMQGISAGEKLNSSTRDDGAIYLGISLNKLLGKKRINLR